MVLARTKLRARAWAWNLHLKTKGAPNRSSRIHAKRRRGARSLLFPFLSVVLIITPLFGLRRPRLEFQQLARSIIDQLTNLTNAKLQDIRERKSSSAALMAQQTALLRKLLSLDSLLTAERRESLYFSANTSILHKIRDSLQRLHTGFEPTTSRYYRPMNWRLFSVVRILFVESRMSY
jgi:hypothetical protein